jgi:hypothetical protein
MLGGCALAPSLAQSSDQSIQWGANGHNDRPDSGPNYAYNRVSLAEQMRLLTGAGLTWYRTGCSGSSCGALPATAKAHGVKLLWGLERWPDAHADEHANYRGAFDYAAEIARRYRGQIDYFEASNEVDVWVGMNGDGSDPSQYDRERYVRARGLIKGLIDGIHAGNPSAKVLVDDAGWCHYGFLRMLWNDGIRWDITAFHWYAKQGSFEQAGCNKANVAEIHASFGLPVWITEFNSDIGAKANDQPASAAWVSAVMAQIRDVAPKYSIQAAFVYELLDEPNLTGAERYFGIADENGQPKATYRAIGAALTQAQP